MKRLKRVLLYLAAALLLMTALAELGIYAENVKTRRKAEALLSAIRPLRVGESTFSNMQNILIDFGARRVALSPVSGSPPEQLYQILAAHFWLYKLELKLPKLWRFGLRPAWVAAEFNYKEENLTSVTYTVDTPMLTSSSEPVELVAMASLGEDTDLEAHRNFNVVYRLRPSFVVPRAYQISLGGIVTPSATQRERDAAFDFDLSCISSLRGCYEFCQIMPSVWREAARRDENKEISLPKIVLENSKCDGR